MLNSFTTTSAAHGCVSTGEQRHGLGSTARGRCGPRFDGDRGLVLGRIPAQGTREPLQMGTVPLHAPCLLPRGRPPCPGRPQRTPGLIQNKKCQGIEFLSPALGQPRIFQEGLACRRGSRDCVSQRPAAGLSCWRKQQRCRTKAPPRLLHHEMCTGSSSVPQIPIYGNLGIEPYFRIGYLQLQFVKDLRMKSS